MDTFLSNAQQIFDVARADQSGDYADFALLVRPDGGLHIIMETPLALDSVAAHEGARIAYRVTRSTTGLRVVGHNGNQTCVLQSRFDNSFQKSALRDQPLYSVTSPLLIPA